MPGGSTIRQFVQDLHDRKSNIARALDVLVGNKPGRHKDDPDPDVQTVVAWLRGDHALDQPLIPEARTILGNLHVSPAELDHIDGWPDGQKNDVRERLVHAIDNDHPFDFYWELHGGAQEQTVVPPLPPPDPRGDIVFRSPREKVSVGSVVTFGAVNVDV